jgi:nuclear transcription factor Y gamma
MSDNNGDRKRQKTDGESGNPLGFIQTDALRHRSQNTLEHKVQQFWKEMMQDVCDSGGDLADFKTAQLPLARIKKIMKSDEDVRMISSEAPVLFAKACEFFILELTLRAWHIADENKRKTLTKADVAAAVAATEVWDFLADTVPQEEGAEVATAAGGQGQAGAPGMMMGAYPVGMMPGMQMYPQGMAAVYVQPGPAADGEEEEEEDGDDEK